MNAIGFDAVALDNHEFDYGLPFLDEWIGQMDAPVPAANAVRAGTRRPAYRPYMIKTMRVPGYPPIRVGLLGLANPGVAIWDKANVSGKTLASLTNANNRPDYNSKHCANCVTDLPRDDVVQ